MAREDAKVEISVIALREMNDPQLASLQTIMSEGQWMHQDEFRIRFDPFDKKVTVQVMNDGRESIFLGIERDGYTHS